MRMPSYLERHTPSGMWHFRLVVPAGLRAAWNRKIIKVSLRTTSPREARDAARRMALLCAAAFDAIRQGSDMSGKHWDDDAVHEMMRGILANTRFGGAA